LLARPERALRAGRLLRERNFADAFLQSVDADHPLLRRSLPAGLLNRFSPAPLAASADPGAHINLPRARGSHHRRPQSLQGLLQFLAVER